jgi:hypothetical protein
MFHLHFSGPWSNLSHVDLSRPFLQAPLLIPTLVSSLRVYFDDASSAFSQQLLLQISAADPPPAMLRAIPGAEAPRFCAIACIGAPGPTTRPPKNSPPYMLPMSTFYRLALNSFPFGHAMHSILLFAPTSSFGHADTVTPCTLYTHNLLILCL